MIDILKNKKDSNKKNEFKHWSKNDISNDYIMQSLLNVRDRNYRNKIIDFFKKKLRFYEWNSIVPLSFANEKKEILTTLDFFPYHDDNRIKFNVNTILCALNFDDIKQSIFTNIIRSISYTDLNQKLLKQFDMKHCQISIFEWSDTFYPTFYFDAETEFCLKNKMIRLTKYSCGYEKVQLKRVSKYLKRGFKILTNFERLMSN